MSTKLFTIGFTKKNAERFFTLLQDAGVSMVIDIRLNNISQLAGFAKRDDLAFFLRKICKCEYQHRPELAPTKEILDSFKKKEFGWNYYENQFKNLLKERGIDSLLSVDELNRSCLLCSEDTADMCHRRLVAEMLVELYPNVELVHL